MAKPVTFAILYVSACILATNVELQVEAMPRRENPPPIRVKSAVPDLNTVVEAIIKSREIGSFDEHLLIENYIDENVKFNIAIKIILSMFINWLNQDGGNEVARLSNRSNLDNRAEWRLKETTSKYEEEDMSKYEEEDMSKYQDEATRKYLEKAMSKYQEEAMQKYQLEVMRKYLVEAMHKYLEEAMRKYQEAMRESQKEAERQRKAEAERKWQKEAMRKRQKEAMRKWQKEAERKRQAEAMRKWRAKAERIRNEEAERKQKEDARRKQKEEAERKRQEEAERKRQEEAERKRQEEAERKRQEEADRLQKEEAERLRKEEAERLQKEKADRLKQEEAELNLKKQQTPAPVIKRCEKEKNRQIKRYEKTGTMTGKPHWIPDCEEDGVLFKIRQKQTANGKVFYKCVNTTSGYDTGKESFDANMSCE